ncbi:13380_t:CDS:2 [Dentiscutata erythropus]|uniref:Cyclin-dependent kinases regulatory subunit n=1 Tax=Dentiscutata erythropus TaxID=1348616 RepID=A0A9N8ZF67_9GLOM|nr:13380_t:CDS:2 [Dentiscutata erythropus]
MQLEQQFDQREWLELDKKLFIHVTLPKQLVPYVPLDRLMPEEEWRSLGVKQSPGWEHYMIHAPEPHILLFKRERDYQLKYGIPQPEEELVEQDGNVQYDQNAQYQQNVQYQHQNVQYQHPQNVQYHHQNVQYQQNMQYQQNVPYDPNAQYVQ